MTRHLWGSNQAQEIYSSSAWHCVLEMAVYFSNQGADVRISGNVTKWMWVASFDLSNRVKSQDWKWLSQKWMTMVLGCLTPHSRVCPWVLPGMLGAQHVAGVLAWRHALALGTDSTGLVLQAFGSTGPFVSTLHAGGRNLILKHFCEIQVKGEFEGGCFGFCCLKYVAFTNNKYF